MSEQKETVVESVEKQPVEVKVNSEYIYGKNDNWGRIGQVK